jgi:hypothetical protein
MHGCQAKGQTVDYCVFIHTNPQQLVGALVSAYSMRRNSAHADKFEVRIINTVDFPFMRERDGQAYLREGRQRIWRNSDLQSFTPLRFMPPELMGYEGRALVVDPDVFAVGDVYELLNRELHGKALMCRPRSRKKGPVGPLATSVMLLDCSRLQHWRCAEQFAAMFEFKRDYSQWISLELEDRETIGLFENYWNDFDRLDENTRLLHNTKRMTQPWKTGLPIDFRQLNFRWFPPKGWLKEARRRIFGDYGLAGHYQPHPDPEQERFFFGLLRECLDQGIVSESELRDEMRQNHVRHDALEVLGHMG